MGRARHYAGKASTVYTRTRYRRGHYELVENAERMRRKPTRGEAWMKQALDEGKPTKGWHWLDQVVMEGYILDFFEPTVRMAIEVDGVHHQENRQALKDAARDKRLAGVGVFTLRVNSSEIERRPTEVWRAIVKAYDDRKAGQAPDPMLTRAQQRPAFVELRRRGLTHNQAKQTVSDPKNAALLLTLLPPPNER